MAENSAFKIVLNRTWGGFMLSSQAVEFMKTRGTKLSFRGSPDAWTIEDDSAKARCDPILIETIEKLKDKANGNVYGFPANLEIISIPERLKSNLQIHNYDGMESVTGHDD